MKNAERISRRHFSAARIANAQIAASTKLIVCFHLINREKKEMKNGSFSFMIHGGMLEKYFHAFSPPHPFIFN